MVKDWTAEERQKLRDDVPRAGFKAAIRGRSVLQLAQETLALAEKGLARRRRLGDDGHDETRYLRPLQDMSRAAIDARGGAAGQVPRRLGRQRRARFQRIRLLIDLEPDISHYLCTIG